jgi:hypothetical protein
MIGKFLNTALSRLISKAYGISPYAYLKHFFRVNVPLTLILTAWELNKPFCKNENKSLAVGAKYFKK